MNRIYVILAVMVAAFLVSSRPARAVTCTQSHVFVTGEVLTASTLNSNPANEVTCVNNIDSTNIGPAGIYASNLIPTNTTQATFGGSVNYTFPATIKTTTASACGGLAGYHIECGNVSAALTCSGVGACGTVGTVNFSTAFTALPLCFISNASGVGSPYTFYTKNWTTSLITVGAISLQTTSTTANANFLCIGT